MISAIDDLKNVICLDILYHLGNSRVTTGYQSSLFPTMKKAQIKSNVYTKPNHTVQPKPVFLRLAFMTCYSTLEINQPA